MFFTNDQGPAGSTGSSCDTWLWKHPRVAYKRNFYLLQSIQPQRWGTDTDPTYPNTNTPFSRNCQITWRHPRSLESSGWGLVYGSSPSEPAKNESWEWGLSCSAETVQGPHTPSCLTVGSAAPSPPRTCARNQHLQRPLLSVALHFRKWAPCKQQNAPSSSQVGKHMPLLHAIISTHVHITTNVMMTTESSNIVYAHC